jgi:2-polyprenyl-3-methyl-5-hydroxy-6-metoxy-1,4-benzoquinol methylase
MNKAKNMTDPAFEVGPYYCNSSVADRALISLRPFICPFAPLLEWVPPGAKLLDLGCGTGLWLLTLAHTNTVKFGLGLDINPNSLKKAQSAFVEYAKLGGSSNLVFQHTREIEDWPSEEKFDVVSLVDVLHHVPSTYQPQFMRRAFELVKPGGRLIYKDMASKPVWLGWGNRIHDLVLARQWINYFPIHSVIEIATKNGGRVIHQSNWQRAFYGHELAVIEK